MPLALHEEFAVVNFLEGMAQQVDASWGRGRIDGFLGALASAGLVRDLGQGVCELHPLLTGFLRGVGQANEGTVEGWARAFVEVMGNLADSLAPHPFYKQRSGFRLLGASFERARGEAERLEMDAHYAALTQALAAYELNRRNLENATRLYAALADHWERMKNDHDVASAYHQLGRVAEERRDFGAAEGWYRKALEVEERLGDDHGAAGAYHQLGMVAHVRRDLGAAEGWYRKALQAFERLGDDHHAAGTYHQLGMVAQERRDLGGADGWYRKALPIFQHFSDEHSAAIVRRSLERLAQLRQSSSDPPSPEGSTR